FLLVAADLAGALFGRVTWAGRPALWAIGSSFVIIFGALTFGRNEVWESPTSLWRDAAEKAPDVYAPQYNLADALRREHKCRDALKFYKRATRLVPTEPSGWLGLGICSIELEKLPEAADALGH